jgi:hypothetical protein
MVQYINSHDTHTTLMHSRFSNLLIPEQNKYKCSIPSQTGTKNIKWTMTTTSTCVISQVLSSLQPILLLPPTVHYAVVINCDCQKRTTTEDTPHKETPLVFNPSSNASIDERPSTFLQILLVGLVTSLDQKFYFRFRLPELLCWDLD